jgi:transposase-like protein
MQCPKCGSLDKVKAGFIGEKQRYQCKNCACKYTRSTPKGLAPITWKLAKELYASGLSLRKIGNLIGVSTPAVLKQIRKIDTTACRLEPQKTTVVELDELCTFLTKKTQNLGMGGCLSRNKANLGLGSGLSWH